MKRMFIVCATIAVMLCSCTKENFVTDEKVNTISATVPTETKTTIDGLHVTWSAGDAITAYNYSDPVSKYTLASGEGTSNAEFELTSGSGVNADGFRGFYPYTTDVFNNVIRYQINMTTQDGVLDGEIPMYGDFVNKGDGTYNIQFKHTCGIVRFVFYGEASKVVSLNRLSLNSNGSKYKNAVKINKEGELLTYESRGPESSLLVVNFTLETIPVIDGKRTVDVLMTPMNVTGADAKTISVWGNGEHIKNYAIPVEAGKITTINVNLKNIEDK